MSFRNQISGQHGIRSAGLQDQRAFSNKRSNSSKRISHERSGSLVEKDLTKRPGHVKRPSLPKQSYQKEEASSRKPLQISSTHHQSLATELQEDLVEFVTSTIPTYLTEIRSFASNTLEKFLFLQEGDLDIHDTIQNFRARKAKIEDQTQQMERGVLKLNFAFNSQKKHVEALKAAQHGDTLSIKRFHSGQEGRIFQKQEDIKVQKLEDIVSYLSQKNNFLLNHLQSSPVKTARIDFSPTKDEQTSLNKNVSKGQQNSKDLFQQIDSLSLVSEIKNLKLQTKDLAADFKNLQEKYREVKKENEYLMRDNIKLRQDLDSTKSLYEIEKQMHQEVKRLLRIKTKTLEIRNTLRKNESPGLSLDSPSIRQNQTVLGLSPVRVQGESTKNSKRPDSYKEKKEVADEDFSPIFKKLEQDNTMLDQLRGELQLLQEKLAKEKEFQKSLQQQIGEKELLQNTQIIHKINYFIQNAVDDTNKSLKDILAHQEPLSALGEFGAEITNFFEETKNLFQSLNQNNDYQSLDILQENIHLILQKIHHSHQVLSSRLLESKLETERIAKSSQESLNRYKQEDEQQKQNYAVSELLKIVGMLKEEYKDFITSGFRIDDATKIPQALSEQVQSLIRNIFTQFNQRLSQNKEEEMLNLNNQLALLGKKVEENSQDLAENHEKLTSYFALLEEKDQKYAQLLNSFNSKEGQLAENASKMKEIANLYQQKEAEIELLKISLEENFKEFQKEREIALSNQMNKVVNKLTQNLGPCKSGLNSEGDQGDLQILEQRVDEICSNYISQINEKFTTSQQNFESSLSLLKNQSEEENTKLVAIKNKLEQDIQLCLKNEVLYKQEIELLSSAEKKIQDESLSYLSKLKEQESDLQLLQEKLEAYETLQEDFDSAEKTILLQNNQIQEFNKETQDLLSNLEKITEEKEVISKRLEQCDSEKEVLIRKIQDQTEAYEMTQMQLSESQKEISEQFNQKALEIEALKQENLNMKNDFDQAKLLAENLKETHQVEINEKSQIIEQLSQIKEKFLDEIESMKSQTINLEAMKNQLEQGLNNKNQEVVELTVQLTSLTEEMKAKEKEVANLLSDRKNVAEMIQTLEAENTKIKENLESFEKELNRYSSERSMLKAEITQLQKELEITLDSKQKLEVQNEQYKALKDDLIEKNKALEEQIETLVQASSESENQIKSLKENLTTKEIEQKKFQEELTFIKIQLQEEEQKTALSETQRERQQEAHEEAISNLSKEMVAVTGQKNELDDEIQQFKLLRDDLVEKIKISEEKNAKLSSTFVDLEDQIKSLKVELETKEFQFSQQIVSLKTQLKEQENERNVSETSYVEQQKSHEGVLSELRKEIEQLKFAKDDLVDKIKLSENNLFDSENQIKSLELELAAKTQEFANSERQFKEQIDSMTIQLHEKENQRALSEAKSEQQQQTHQEMFSALSKEFEILNEQKQTIEKQFSQLKLLNEGLEEKEKSLESQLEVLREQLDTVKLERTQEFTKTEQQFQQQIESLKVQMISSEKLSEEQRKSSEEIISNLSKEVIALKELNIELNNKLAVQEKEIKQLESLRDDLVEKIKSLENTLFESKDQIKSLKEELAKKEIQHTEEIATHKQQIESLEMQVKEEENKISASEIHNKEQQKSHEEALSSLNQKIALLNEQKVNIENKLSAQEKEIKQLESLRNNLDNRIKSLENTLFGSEDQIKSLKEDLLAKETQYSQEIAANKQQIESLEMQVKEEENKRSASEIYNEEQQKSHDEVLSSLNQKIALLTEQKMDVQNKLSAQEKENIELESLRDDLANRIKSSENNLFESEAQVKSLKEDFAAKETQHSQEIAANKQQIESLEKQVKEEENKRNTFEIFNEEQQNSHEEVLSSLNQRIALLIEQKMDVENNLSAQEKENNKLESLRDSLVEKIKLLENALFESEDQVKSLKEDLLAKETQHSQEIVANRRQIELLEMQVKEEENKRSASDLSNEEQDKSHKEALSNLMNDVALLNEQNIALQNQLSSQEKQIKQLEGLRDDFAEKIKLLENTLLESEAQIKSLNDDLAEKETQHTEEIATHKKQIELVENQLKEEQNKRSASEISNEEQQKSHEETLSSLNQKLALLSEQKVDLENKLSIQEKENYELESLRDNLVEKIKLLENTLFELEAQIKSLNTDLTEKGTQHTEEIATHKKQIELLENQLKGEQNKRSASEIYNKEQQESHKEVLSSLNQKVLLLSEQKMDVENKLSAQEKENDQLDSLKDSLVEKIKLLENTLFDSEGQIKSLKEELAKKEIHHTEETATHKQQIESLEIQLKEEEKKRNNSEICNEEQQKSHEEALSSLNQKIALLTEQKMDLENKLSAQENEIAQLEKLRVDLDNTIKSLEGTLADSENQIKSLEANLTAKSQESVNAEQIFNEQIEILKIQIDQEKNQRASSEKFSEEQKVNFEKETEQLRFERDDLVEQIKTLENSLIESESQIKSLGENLTVKTQEITHAEQIFKQETESLKTQLEEEKSKRALYEELQQTFSRVSTELTTLTEQRSDSEKQIEQLQLLRDDYIEKIKSLENTLLDSENQITSLKEEIASLKEQIESLEAQLEEEENKRVSSEALYEEHQAALQEALSSVSKELETLTEQKNHAEKELSENLASINSFKEKLDESNKRLKSELNERLDALRKLDEKQKEIDQLKETSIPATNPQGQDVDLTKKLLAFLETLTQHTLHHTKAIYQGIESTTVRDVEFAFYGAFKEIIESNNTTISKLSEIKLLELDLFKGHEALVSELVDQLNQSMEQNQKAKNLCENLERISCAASPISLKLHRMRSYQEEAQSAAFDPKNLDMSGSISKYESSFMDLAAQNAGADLEDSLSQKDEALKSLESKIGSLNVSHQKIAEENNLLKRNVENTSKVQGQLRVANEKFAVEYDKLIDELKDRETDEERFALQIKILKKELEETRTRLAQSEGANEREHLKKILLKFLEIILRGKQAKETSEMLKIICSLLFCSEAEKNKLLELLNRTIPKKTSSLLKVFS